MAKEYSDISLLSISEACKILNISRKILNSLINTGRIKCAMIGKRIKIPYCELKRFVEESTFSNVDITNQLITYGNTSSTNIPEFDTVSLFENIMEEFNNGKRI